MSQPTAKPCYYSCTCNKDGCSFKHFIEDSNERSLFREMVYVKLYDKEAHNETDPEGCRHSACIFGMLCGKDNCGFKHGANPVGRNLMITEWRRQSKQLKVKSLIDELKGLAGDNEQQLAVIEKLEKLVVYQGSTSK